MDLQIIHVVLGKANPNRMNGVNKVVNSLAHHQTEVGVHVEVWGITKNVLANYPDRKYKTQLFKDRGKYRLDPRIEALLDELPSQTVFHLHGGFIPQFYLFAHALKRRGIHYVLTPHGAYNRIAMQRSAFKKRVYIELLERKIVEGAKCIHFIGQSEIEGAKSAFVLPNFALIPNGQTLCKTLKTARVRTEHHKTIFGFVGRLDIKTKGLDLLLQAFAKFDAASRQSAELWIIGGGQQMADLQALALALHIQESVRFLGPQFGEDKTSLIAQMDFLCLTSRNEGMPGVVLEAAALGVPVIVSQETNLAKYVQQCRAGIGLHENSVEELLLAMNVCASWLKTPKMKRASDNAIRMIQTHFNWENIAQQLIKVYAA